MNPTKNVLLTVLSVVILCSASLGHAELLQEMGMIDHGITTAVEGDPHVGILIVTSVIPELSFASNMGIIRVDDSTSGKWIVYLHPGTNIITFMAERYKSVSRRLVVPKKKVHTVEVKPLIRYGMLTVESNPPGARIFLDGEDTGKQTPYFFENLKAGPHLVVLKIDDYQRDTSRLNVKPEVVLRINRTLQAVGYLSVNTVPSAASVVIEKGTDEAITVTTPIKKMALKEKANKTAALVTTLINQKNTHGTHTLEFCYPEGWARP